MEDLIDLEEKILCPYNNSHHIQRCRMSAHLVKCQKNYGKQRKIPCDFNATHLINEIELQYHHQTCPDRKKIEAQICTSQDKSQDKFPVYNVKVTAEENWDDCNYSSYNPAEYSENNDVLRRLDVASKGKRRNFRLNERQRLNHLGSNDNDNDNVGDTANLGTVTTLPSHREVTNIKGTKYNLASLRDKIEKGSDEVFLRR